MLILRVVKGEQTSPCSFLKFLNAFDYDNTKKKRRYINNPVPLAISGSGFVDVSFLPFISSDVMLKVKGLDSRSMTPLDLCLYITFCNLLMLQYFNTGILFQGSAASFFGFRGLYHVVPDKRTLPRNTPRNSGLQFPGYI